MVCFFYLLLFGPTTTHSKCTSSIGGLVLTRHAYRSFASSDMMACYQNCRNEELCQSINFHRDSRICELNNRTDVVSPVNFVKKEDAFYFVNPFRGEVLLTGRDFHVWKNFSVCYVLIPAYKHNGTSTNKQTNKQTNIHSVIQQTRNKTKKKRRQNNQPTNRSTNQPNSQLTLRSLRAW